MLKAAEITQQVTPHGLRDTFASQLLSAGVQLAYVSNQLGHADVAITARSYARWCGSEYRPPLVLAEGEVPADLLARLGRRSVPNAHSTAGA
jgi:integrase